MKFRRAPRVIPGLPLAMGVTLLYLGLIVLLPVSGLLFRTFGLEWSEFVAVVTHPRAVASYKVTLESAAYAVAFNAVFGLLLAWVLVRYDFPGRRLLDAVMDLPFALPTAVAGVALTAAFASNGWLGQYLEPLGIKVAYTQLGIIVAMAFTSVPFVVRSLQPVIADLEPELEEAAETLGASPFQTFTKVIFPLIFPAFLTGVSLAFARSLGEFGAIIFIAGNMPFLTEITALVIFIRLEEYDYAAATAIATVVLASAFVMLLITNSIQLWHYRYARKN
nr:sulfate ABC transporter permease subunit CysT [Telmatospirillum sp. J64-1]